ENGGFAAEGQDVGRHGIDRIRRIRRAAVADGCQHAEAPGDQQQQLAHQGAVFSAVSLRFAQLDDADLAQVQTVRARHLAILGGGSHSHPEKDRRAHNEAAQTGHSWNSTSSMANRPCADPSAPNSKVIFVIWRMSRSGWFTLNLSNAIRTSFMNAMVQS